MEKNTQCVIRVSDIIIHRGDLPLVCNVYIFVCNPYVYKGTGYFMPILTGQ